MWMHRNATEFINRFSFYVVDSSPSFRRSRRLFLFGMMLTFMHFQRLSKMRINDSSIRAMFEICESYNHDKVFYFFLSLRGVIHKCGNWIVKCRRLFNDFYDFFYWKFSEILSTTMRMSCTNLNSLFSV